MTALGELVDWTRRARRALPSSDRRALVDPFWLATRFARFAWHRALGRPRCDDDAIPPRDPALAGLLLDLVEGPGRRYFRYEAEGVEHLPTRGPALLVGNHSGGLLPTDGLFVALELRRRSGPERAMHALAHDFVFDDPKIRSYAGRIGLLRAQRSSAERALRRGDCVLVYPGSDRDAFRAFRDRRRVMLSGRKGFVRLALTAGVPIVPFVSAGVHEQMVVLTRGDGIARALRMHAWARTDVFPIVLSVPWGVTTGFLPYWPLPAQITLRFGPPHHWPDLGPAAASAPHHVDACYAEVESRMQAMLDELHVGRRAWLGRSRPRRRNPAAADPPPRLGRLV
jgi:1-acyl-sn-glycerol-3-phosphate acyltransferase